MKKKDLTSLKAKSKDELQKQVTELRLSLIKAELDLSARRLKNTNLPKTIKKNLAQVLTLIQEKELVTK